MVRSRTSFPEGDFRPIEALVIILHGEDHFEAGTFCRSSSAKFSRKVKLVVNSSWPKQVQAGHGGLRPVWRDCADTAAKSLALQGTLIGSLPVYCGSGSLNAAAGSRLRWTGG